MTTDVCVVGGGPAGSVLATRLAQLGHDVCLLERGRFPRPHLGESLSPGVPPLLASVGAEWTLDAAGARPVSRVRRRWGASASAREDPRAAGRVVDRGRLDAGLLAHARSHGVRVWQPASLTRQRRLTTGGWALEVRGLGASATSLQARMLVIATGRTRRGSDAGNGPRTLALYAYWAGASLPDDPSIESMDDGWCWGVPIPGIGYNALAFVDAERVRGGGRDVIEACYARMMAQSSLVAPGARATRTSRVRVADATPVVSATCVDDGYLCVGDAALALDPLSSSGVQKAVQNALAGAIVANTMLRRPDATDDAMACFRDQVHGAAARHAAWSGAHYAEVAALLPDRPFWSARAGAPPDLATVRTAEAARAPVTPDTPLVLSPLASLRQIPCLEEEFVTRRAALHHPALDAPVAFIGGRPVAALLDAVPDAPTADGLVRHWGLGVADGRAIARWFVTLGILVPQADHRVAG